MNDRLARICIGATMIAVAAPLAAQTWQAIAVSPSSGEHGYSFGHGSRVEAEREAKEACQKTDCEIASSSQQCLVLVESPGQRAFAAVVPADRTASALADLCTARGQQSCTVKRSVCEEQVQAATILD